MKLTEYLQMDATSLATLVRNGEVLPQEILELAVQRVDEVNPTLNPVVTDLRETALSDIESGILSGALSGVPFLVKDVEADVSGVPTTNCSRLFEDFVPARDSEFVSRVRSAGGIVIGKSNAPELAYSSTTEPALFGPYANPWDSGRSVGGSSGGAACAVAAGIVPIAHASDGGGSTRLPAAFCGVVGLKPSRGRISVAPGSSTARGGLIVDGCVSRTVRDAALFLDVAGGPAIGDPYAAPQSGGAFRTAAESPPGPQRVALITEFDGVDVDPEMRAAAVATARLCEELGHHVDATSFPVRLEDLLGIAGVLVPSYLAALVDRRLAALGRPLEEDDLEPMSRAGIERGRAITAIDYVNAQERAIAVGRCLGEFQQGYDIILTPTSTDAAPLLGAFDHSHLPTDPKTRSSHTAFTRPFNVTGAPALTLPAARARDGMPIGVQVGGRYGEEALLFSFAAQLEATDTWPERLARGPWLGASR